nr:multidrug resistance-associated protein 5 [Tanacetum cinerariifolium]
MIPAIDLHQFDVHNDGYFAFLPLNYVDGVILVAVPRMPYEQLAEFLEEKCGFFFLERQAEMEVETEGVEAWTSTTEGVEARNITIEGAEARNRTKDKGKGKVSKDASDVVETRRCTVKVNTETEYESDDKSDYQSDNSVDYLSPSEDELIELRNRMKANRKEKAKAKDKPDSGMNEPNEENIMPADNVRGETFEEHDIYMNELLKSLKTVDKDGITEDPFISVEKHVEMVVAKCGQRPPRVFAPEKDGWKADCRKIIALDDCFLERPNQGEILTAIGRDGNNHIYPVAWAVVNVENKDNWTWFLELLEEDLGCSRGNMLTLMSDQHKEMEPWGMSKHQKEIGMAEGTTKVSACNTCWWEILEVRSGSEGFTVNEGKRTYSCRMWQLSGLHCVHATKVILLINRLPKSYVPTWFKTDMYFVTYHNYVKPVCGMNFLPDQNMYCTVLPPKPKKMPSRPKKKRIRAISEGCSSTRVSKRGLVRDEGASGTRGGAIRSRGRGCAARSRGGASRSIGRGAGGSGGASGSKGRGTAGSRGGASGSTAGTQNRQEKTQAKPQHTQHELEQTQVEDQVEQLEDQDKIDLTQVEQTQEQTQKQVQPQEQPQQDALRMQSVRILQKKLRKQGGSQNTALHLD